MESRSVFSVGTQLRTKRFIAQLLMIHGQSGSFALSSNDDPRNDRKSDRYHGKSNMYETKADPMRVIGGHVLDQYRPHPHRP